MDYMRLGLIAVVFAGSLLMDLLFAYWTKSVVKGHRTAATALSGVYYMVSMGIVALFVGDTFLIPVSALGHMVGTWIAVNPQPEVKKTQDCPACPQCA